MATKTAGTDKDAILQRTAARAYTIWETEGRPHGRDVLHWEQAEAEVQGAGRARHATSKAASKTTAKTATKMPPKVAAAMTAAAGETQRRTTRAASKTTKKPTTATRKKR